MGGGPLVDFTGSAIHDNVNEHCSKKREVVGPTEAPDVVEERIRELAAQGMGKVKIAKTLGVGVSLTQRILA